jgi:glycosyltransferase involved in cell wall biosynthesis
MSGKNVVFFINNLAIPGGSERVCTVIANRLVEFGYKITIVEWMDKGESFYEINEKIKVIKLYNREVNIYKTYPLTLWRFYKAMRHIKPDYIIDVCSALSIVSIPISLFLRTKNITWEHFNAKSGWNAFTPKIARTLAARFAYKIVVLSETDKQNYIRLFNAKQTQVILNPVTINTKGEVANLQSNTILAAGRFTPQKGFDMLLHSFKLVHSKYPHWKLNIVGNGELFVTIKNLAAELNILNAVSFSGTTQNMHRYYTNASFFVLSSRFEGLPLVLIEAQAYGLPVVSFNCPTGPQEIITHGKNGLLVEPNNIEKLAEAMELMIANEQLRADCALQALVKAKDFEINKIVKQWINLLS